MEQQTSNLLMHGENLLLKDSDLGRLDASYFSAKTFLLLIVMVLQTPISLSGTQTIRKSKLQ
jgi:hypothetical protein